MPPYVDIEMTPFDPDTFDCHFPEDATKEEMQQLSIREIEKTLRWRNVTDAHGNKVSEYTKQATVAHLNNDENSSA